MLKITLLALIIALKSSQTLALENPSPTLQTLPSKILGIIADNLHGDDIFFLKKLVGSKELSFKISQPEFYQAQSSYIPFDLSTPDILIDHLQNAPTGSPLLLILHNARLCEPAKFQRIISLFHRKIDHDWIQNQTDLNQAIFQIQRTQKRAEFIMLSQNSYEIHLAYNTVGLGWKLSDLISNNDNSAKTEICLLAKDPTYQGINVVITTLYDLILNNNPWGIEQVKTFIRSDNQQERWIARLILHELALVNNSWVLE